MAPCGSANCIAIEVMPAIAPRPIVSTALEGTITMVEFCRIPSNRMFIPRS